MIQHIINYIKYIEKQHGLLISLHPMKLETLVLYSELFSYNIHKAPYCICVKSDASFAKKCIECQKRVFEKVKSGAFSGECYAGVFEFVFPIKRFGETIGFISVSGYKKQGKYKAEQIGANHILGESSITAAYDRLIENIPDNEFITTLIMPISYMLEQAYQENTEKSSKNDMDQKILEYITKNHNYDISVEDLCAKFLYSRSYLCHRFSRINGMGIKEYILRLRTEDAKRLLSASSLNITEIARAVGYSDINCFSQMFKKLTGVSPKRYREMSIKK